MREVGTNTRTIFENPGFSYPEIHDTTIVYQIIAHTQDKAGMWLRTLVSIRRFFQFAVFGVYIVVTLGFTSNTIALVQTSIKPLW